MSRIEGPVIGLFGGAFNPPHMAHVMAMAWVLAGGKVDNVWVIPSGGHPFGKEMAPFPDRMEMCRRAFECFADRIRILDIEGQPKTHYTVETLERLAQLYPGYRWRWMMGSDTLEEADRWHAFDRVMQLAPPLMIPRQGHADAQTEIHQGVALPDLSSTMVREAIRNGQAEQIASLVPAAVADWIERRRLYRSDPA